MPCSPKMICIEHPRPVTGLYFNQEQKRRTTFHTRQRKKPYQPHLINTGSNKVTITSTIDLGAACATASVSTTRTTHHDASPSTPTPLESTFISRETNQLITPPDSAIADSDADDEDLPPPAELRSSTMNRGQLLQRFYDLHLGSSAAARKLFSYESLDTNNPNMLATRAAMDTLYVSSGSVDQRLRLMSLRRCVAQLATAFQDHTLMMQTKIMYGKALRLLNMRLQRMRPDRPSQTQLDDVIGAIQAITPCAWFTCVEADSLDWKRHTGAVLNIIDVYGWKAISPPKRRAFYYNWKFRSFFNSLCTRTKFEFKEPPLDAGTMDLASSFLTDHAFDVSGLLWRCDKFLRAARSKSVESYMIIRILTELGICVARLKDWYLQWVKHFPKDNPHFRTVGTHNYASFSSLCGEHFGTFPMAYNFSGGQHERDFRVLCICLLNVDIAIMDINRAFPQYCKSAQLQLQRREAEYDAATCASDLCMVIPWSTQPEFMAFACIHSYLPLHYASLYYHRQRQYRQLAWCLQVSSALSAKYGIQIKFSE